MARDRLLILRYVFVGATTAFAYFSLYCLLVLGMNSPSTLASISAMSIAIAYQYVMHARFTYRTSAGNIGQLVKFLCAAGVSLFVGAAFGYAGPRLGIHPIVTGLGVCIASPVVNYILFTIWVFADRTQKVNP